MTQKLNLRFAALAVVSLFLLPASGAFAIPINGYAAMGASETQGGPTDTKGSWVPWLANDRGLDFGPSQNRNVAIGGSTTQDLLTAGQHTKVAGFVAADQADVAFLFCGGLDMSQSTALQIALGNLSGATWANGVVSRLVTAMDTVLAANNPTGTTGMVVAGVPDMSLTPGVIALDLPPEVTAPGIAAIDLANALLKAEVLARNLVFLDVASAMRDMNAAPLVVGGVTINTTVGNPNPTHFFTDSVHPGFVGNGIFANLMLTALNVGYGQSIAPFTDQAILQKAGLSGSYTGETSDLSYADYVYFNAVPEPTSFVLLGMAGVAFVMIRRRVRR